MKKWILIVVLYGVGFLFVKDVMNNLEWIGEQFQAVYDWNPDTVMYFQLGLIMVPMLFLLVNYFSLRTRANNPVFTFLNAMFLTVFILTLALHKLSTGSDGFVGVFEAIVDVEVWKGLWHNTPVLLVGSGLSLISGIVISEAKTKGTYLTAEFIYLFTGILLAIMAVSFFY